MENRLHAVCRALPLGIVADARVHHAIDDYIYGNGNIIAETHIVPIVASSNHARELFLLARSFVDEVTKGAS